ncbi:MAG: MFS transporter [Tissierellia bacterium]|nr:MFS transporter [Tissierellia bacterium]
MNKSLKIALGSFVMLMSGLMYSWSVLSIPIKEELTHISQGSMSMVFTLAMALFCLGGLVTGILKTRAKGSLAVVIALIMMPTGYFMTSKANNAIGLFIGYGFLVGFSVGIIYTYILSNLTNLIPGKQGLISGILLFGFGMSSMIFGPLYTKLISSGFADWRELFRYFSVLIFVIMLIVLFFIKDENIKRDLSEKDSFSVEPKDMLKTNVFKIYFIWALIYTAIGIAIISQGANIMKLSIPSSPESLIALFIGILSISNGFGRIIVGYIFDKYGFVKSMLIVGIMAASSQLIMMLNMKLGMTILMLIAFILLGLSYGGVPSNNSAFIIRLFGEKYYSMNLSYLNLNILIASFASVISGNLYDNTGSYIPTFAITLILSAIGIALVFMIEKKAKA